MRLRPASEIRADIAHASACLAHLADAQDWADKLMAESYTAQLRQLERELNVADRVGLSVVLDGQGVHEHTVAADRLAGFLAPFQRSIRNVAAAETRQDGDSFTSSDRLLTDAHVASMFDGSVGLHIVGPPGGIGGEQLEFFRPTLFDRSVSHVLDLLDAASAEDVEGVILERAAGLSSDAVSALKELATWIADAGAPTRFGWHGTFAPTERFVTVLPAEGAALAVVLESVVQTEVPVTVVGTLSAVDSHDGTFHLVALDGTDYRGTIAEGQMRAALDAEHRDGTQVELLEVVAVGKLARRSRPKYVLTGVG